jgi:hypothetical protein
MKLKQKLKKEGQMEPAHLHSRTDTELLEANRRVGEGGTARLPERRKTCVKIYVNTAFEKCC